MGADLDTAGGMRRERGGRVRKETRAPSAKKNRHLSLSDDAWERLGVHALRWGLDKSALVERLISENLKQYVVQDRGGRPPLEGQASRNGGEKESGEDAMIGEGVTSSALIPEGVASGAGEGDAVGPPPAPKRRNQAGTR